MVAGAWPGKRRIDLLPKILEFEDLVEGDFAEFYRIDYRDRYLPGGGPSRLTLRRLLLLVERLPSDSAFMSELSDRVPISSEMAVTMGVWEALTKAKHPLWTARQKQREEVERAERLAAARERARKFNRPRRGLIP